MSAQTSLSEVQTAIYSKLTGDTTLMNMLAAPLMGTFAVFGFGNVPENQSFPYITLGDAQEIGGRMNAFGTRGYLTMVKIHIWDSQFGGFQKAQQILARLNVLLDQKDQSTIPLATQKLVYLLYQAAIPMNDPGDNKILHTSVEYESFTQEQ